MMVCWPKTDHRTNRRQDGWQGWVESRHPEVGSRHLRPFPHVPSPGHWYFI